MNPIEPIDLEAVLAWGERHRRDLPWRRSRDPWRVLVSEMMLQQTQVDRVIPKWEEFVAAFPDPPTCAAASLGDVLRLWQGLGYPRRARNLHDTAALVVDRHGGRVPDDLDALVDLPGIGPYTARAVLTFAFERDVGVVDTNIARVLARIAGARMTSRIAQGRADAMVPPGQGWAWNQTLMDIGAAVCRLAPRCESCPLGLSCGWNQQGRPDPDPAVGSAGVSTRQAPFAGSDRQQRGRVMAAVAAGPAPAAEFDARIVESLLADRLIVRDQGVVRLP